jgi:hypothetical protein
MKNFILLTISIFFVSCVSKKALPAQTPYEYVQSIIDEIEQGTIDKQKGYAGKLPNQLVCLSGIAPKELDLNYFGYVYTPTLSEIELWKEWLKNNKDKLKFDLDRNLFDQVFVAFEYEKNKFRYNYCNQ